MRDRPTGAELLDIAREAEAHPAAPKAQRLVALMIGKARVRGVESFGTKSRRRTACREIGTHHTVTMYPYFTPNMPRARLVMVSVRACSLRPQKEPRRKANAPSCVNASVDTGPISITTTFNDNISPKINVSNPENINRIAGSRRSRSGMTRLSKVKSTFLAPKDNHTPAMLPVRRRAKFANQGAVGIEIDETLKPMVRMIDRTRKMKPIESAYLPSVTIYRFLIRPPSCSVISRFSTAKESLATLGSALGPTNPPWAADKIREKFCRNFASSLA